jgi:hypothetical protein
MMASPEPGTGKVNHLYAKYRERAVILGGEMLFRHSEALQFIEDARRLEITILGMDFRVEESGGLVEYPTSADYSALADRPGASKKTTGAALDLIREGLPDGASLVSFVIQE